MPPPHTTRAKCSHSTRRSRRCGCGKRILQKLQPLGGEVLAARDDAGLHSAGPRDAAGPVPRAPGRPATTNTVGTRGAATLAALADSIVVATIRVYSGRRHLGGERTQALGLGFGRAPHDRQIAFLRVSMRLQRLDELAVHALAVRGLDLLEIAHARALARRAAAPSRASTPGGSRQHEPAAIASRRCAVCEHGVPSSCRAHVDEQLVDRVEANEAQTRELDVEDHEDGERDDAAKPDLCTQ